MSAPTATEIAATLTAAHFSRRKKQSEVVVLASSAAAVSVGANTDEEALATITIPAGAMGPNGWLRVFAHFTITGSTNQKTARIRLGGIGGTSYGGAATSTSGHVSIPHSALIFNAGAENSQKGMNTIAASGSGNGVALITGAIDTAAETTLVITGQKASAGETMTLNYYVVELHYAD